MARISGVDIPREKRVEIALTYIHGIGRPSSVKMCQDLGINPSARVRDLSDSDVNKIRVYIENNLKVEGDRRRDVQQDIKRKIETGSYQGSRHRKGLPGPRSAHPHQRPYPQGTQEDRRQQESRREEVNVGHVSNTSSTAQVAQA